MNKGLNTSPPPGSFLLSEITITSPQTDSEWQDYFQLRWRVLRQPWNQLPGSERDELENQSFHVMALDQNKVIGVGRIHKLNDEQAQIRYMAVQQHQQRSGVGGQILERLEEQAKDWNTNEIKINARDSHLSFYLKHGYQQTGPGHTLYNVITHTKVFKALS